MCLQSVAAQPALVKNAMQGGFAEMVESVSVMRIFGDVRREGDVMSVKEGAHHDIDAATWGLLPVWVRQAVLSLVLQCERAHAIEVADISRTGLASAASSQSLDGMTSAASSQLLQCDFECVEVPEIKIQEYAGVLFHSFPSLMTWVRALSLLRRFCDLTRVQLSCYTVHRLLLTSLYVTSKFQGLGVDIDLSWGIRADDLLSMEASFVEGIDNDFNVSVAACLCELLPFDKCPREAVVAAGLLVAECVPRPGFDTRMRNWVEGLVCPDSEARAERDLPVFDVPEVESVDGDDLEPGMGDSHPSTGSSGMKGGSAKSSIRSVHLGLSQRISQTVRQAKSQSSSLVRKLFRKTPRNCPPEMCA